MIEVVGRAAVLPEPAAGECLHGGVARRLEAVCLIATIRKGKIDRTRPGNKATNKRLHPRHPR